MDALEDNDEETRLSCLDQLEDCDDPQVVAKFIHALKTSDNARIDRAATALGRMKDKSAIPYLIDVLASQQPHPDIPGK